MFLHKSKILEGSGSSRRDEIMDLHASQPSSHCTLEPISADVLAAIERSRRDGNKISGFIRTGCGEIDDQALLGGLEKGSVVGLSAEDENMGSLIGIQAVANSLIERTITRAMVITPKPVTFVAGELRNACKAQMEQREPDGDANTIKSKLKECLDDVMLSCIFDIDGLWETLSELDPVTSPGSHHDQEQATRLSEDGTSKAPEIQDSDEDLTPPPSEPNSPEKPSPELILITHFSSLLHTLFTQREKSAAHTALQLLSTHLRYLSRNLSSQPLILLLNSTSSNTSDETTAPQRYRPQPARPPAKPLDLTLRSIFNPPTLDLPGYHNFPSLTRRNKPTFGLVFAQFLDLHLLATRVVRGKEDADIAFGGTTSAQELGKVKCVTVVEVLLDESGVWEGQMGSRTTREQRWGAVTVDRGVVKDAFRDEWQEGGRDMRDIRVAAGFGGPSHRHL